jgi:hypothetical protein
VLSQREAARLARDSELAPGSRHAQAALRRLAEAGDSGNRAAIDAVWRSWCRAPDDARWDLLLRWRDATKLTEAACTAALLQLAGAGETGSRLPRVAFCVARGLAPADPVERALFYLLTGQQAQHRAADPDGVLTARGYAAADPHSRRMLRQALADAGSLDLMRVIADSGTRTPLTPAEWGYLASQLTSRLDWDGLWQVVRDMPIAEAAEWARRFSDGWRPAGERDRALFGLLRAADPAQVRAGRDALAERFSRFAVSGGQIHSGALSGDGWRLAVVMARGDDLAATGRRQRTVVTEFDVDTGATSAEFHVGAASRHVTAGYLDGALAVAIGKGQGGYADGALFRLPGSRMVPLPGALRGSRREDFFAGPVSSPPGGFAVLASDRLTLHDGDGAVAGTLALTVPGPWTPGKVVPGPDGLLALLGIEGVTLYDTREPGRPQLVGHAGIGDPDSLCFPGPRHMVVKSALRLAAWRLGDSGLELEASYQIAARVYTPAIYRRCLVPVHRGNAVALLRGSGDIEFRDARTLAKVPLPEWLPVGRARQLWSSPDGTRWALAGQESVAVPRDRHPAADVADRPAAEWIPGDLVTLMAAVADPALHPSARPLAELLRDCLQWRFGREVRLGRAGSLPSPDSLAEDDIALPPGMVLPPGTPHVMDGDGRC